MLLTATPVHLHSNDLFQLLNLVDQDTFHYPGSFDDILQANQPLVRARELLVSGSATPEELRHELDRARGFPVLQGNRQLEALSAALPDAESLRDRKVVTDLAFC